MAQKRQNFDWRFLFLLPLPLIWCLLDHYGELARLENQLLNLRFRFRGAMAAPVKLTYVDVDTRALQTIGQSPWDRARFAEAAEYLFEAGGVRAIGYDFVFSALNYSELVEKARAERGNLALARAGRKYPQIVLAAQYTGGQAQTQEGIRRIPLLRQGATDRAKNDTPELPQYPIVNPASSATIGLIDVDFEYSRGAIPRWIPLFAESSTIDFWHMAVQLACIELGLPPGSARRAGDFIELVTPEGRVVRRIPVAEQQLLEVNWFAPWAHAHDPHFSLADVLLWGRELKSENEAERKEAEAYFAQFKGAVVLIGPVDSLLQDLAPSPFDDDPVPKVGLHGNALKTILSEIYLQRTEPWVMWLATFGLTFAVAGLSISGGARSLFSKVLAMLVLAAFAMANFYVFAETHLVLPLAAPLGAAFTTGFAAATIQLVLEEKQKGRIKNLFGTYLSPQLVNQMVESEADPQLGGHEDVITAYFSDIQSFSTFSELMPPSQLVELMNEYLTVCTDIIQEEGGTLDKYIGDAVVAIFGAPVALPDHAYRACVSTLRVQKEIDRLRDKWKGETGKWPEVVHNLRARLGLNTGSAIIGNMGSRSRFSYTMMGDNVNLAARMESGAKSLGVYIMVTEATKLACEQHGGDRIVFRYLDRIVVKGRSQPVPVFEVVGFRADLPQKTFDCLGIYAQGIERYLAQDWDGATKLFEQCAVLEPNQPHHRGIESNPSHVLLKRCAYMKAHPPGAGWDGVYVMKEK
ncbi:MAG TPA: adenylate/guanylate cyclase domain-containing protein [Opitutaceae bacterium]|nr:adenylate/guanylate cyclase domain-containing protein [Opitutaceae bacterium]